MALNFSFSCSICNVTFKSELDLNTHYLFTHNQYRGFCESDKLIKFNLTIEELKLKFSRLNKNKFSKMLNRKLGEYYYNNFTHDEEFIYFFVKLFSFYNFPINRLTSLEIFQIKNLSAGVRNDFTIMRNHLIQYELSLEPYHKVKPISKEKLKELSSW